MNLHDTTGKHTIYVVQDDTRYGTDIWDLGTPNNIEISYETFYFDVKAEPEIEDVEEQIARIIELQDLTSHPTLDQMLTDRQEWLDRTREYERQNDAAEAEHRTNQLEAARALLRGAGELP
jgi:hypothetical protein